MQKRAVPTFPLRQAMLQFSGALAYSGRSAGYLMFAARPNLFAIICLALVVSVAPPGWAAQKRSARKTAQKPDPVPEQTTPPPPPTPQTLAQMPAVPPQ